MGGQDIRDRAFEFAVRVVRLSDFLNGNGGVSKILGYQVLRSGTSIGANLEEAEGGHSRADFSAKCSIALKEARETRYWLRLLVSSGIVSEESLRELVEETEEITAILTSIAAKSKSGVHGLPADQLSKIRETHPNAYKPWTAEEDRKLTRFHQEGKDVDWLVEQFGRRRGAINARLEKLGLVAKETRN